MIVAFKDSLGAGLLGSDIQLKRYWVGEPGKSRRRGIRKKKEVTVRASSYLPWG